MNETSAGTIRKKLLNANDGGLNAKLSALLFLSPAHIERVKRSAKGLRFTHHETGLISRNPSDSVEQDPAPSMENTWRQGLGV